ncbi:tryptophan halogenase family protein [Henriciella sp. AS95]|uniref:tryptophan halogenase family protein n=1 Tax=Henriciella sp. AS95 TaxID=3135782 RepID=UPI0031807427
MSATSKPVQTITIVGGGTAGWITAGILASAHDAASGRIKVRVIESPDIPTIGVGEGTWPTMRATLKAMGVRESDFLRACSASFKQGSMFAGWVSGAADDVYYHPFELPLSFFETNPARAWLQGGSNTSFSKSVCPQEFICEAHLAPKTAITPDFAGVSNYGYHLDAGKFSAFIRTHCTNSLGVEHIPDTVVEILADPSGDIRAMKTQHYGEVDGDLFIDCTGFRSLLLGQHCGIGLKPLQDQLFIDTALAVQVPYEDGDPVRSQTVSTAQAAGWIWDIGLSNRRGVGHVYSSRYTDEEQAREALRTYLGMSEAQLAEFSVRKLDITSGYREKFWDRNCVAIGLSAGFVEPLEASAIVMIEMSAKMIAAQLPATRAAMDVVAKRFNRTFTHHWERIVDFLKLHYVLSQRSEPFWVDNRDPATLSNRLREDLGLWEHQPPWTEDFDHKDEIFPAASYQYVLYGMGYRTAPDRNGLTQKEKRVDDERRAQIDRLLARGLSQLETNRAVLDRVQASID